jgi:hypothetical protein
MVALWGQHTLLSSFPGKYKLRGPALAMRRVKSYANVEAPQQVATSMAAKQICSAVVEIRSETPAATEREESAATIGIAST